MPFFRRILKHISLGLLGLLGRATPSGSLDPSTFELLKCGGRAGAYSGAWLGSAQLLQDIEIDGVFRGLEAGSHLVHASVRSKVDGGAYKFDPAYLDFEYPHLQHNLTLSPDGSVLKDRAEPQRVAEYGQLVEEAGVKMRGGFSVVHLSAFEHAYFARRHIRYESGAHAPVAEIFKRTADKECAASNASVPGSAAGDVLAELCSGVRGIREGQRGVTALVPFHAPSCIDGDNRGAGRALRGDGRKLRQLRAQCRAGTVPRDQGNAHSVVDSSVKYDYLRATLCSLRPWVRRAVVVVLPEEAAAVRRVVGSWAVSNGGWLHVVAADTDRHDWCAQPRMLPVCTLQMAKDERLGVGLPPSELVYYTESDQVARWGTDQPFLCAAVEFLTSKNASAYITPVWVESRAKLDPLELRGAKAKHCGCSAKYTQKLSPPTGKNISCPRS